MRRRALLRLATVSADALMARPLWLGRPTPALPFCRARLAAPRPSDPAYPVELRTIGDHIRARRLGRGLLQRQAAEEIGVVVESIRNWELGWRAPAIRHLPGIIRFLGYSP